jgi:ATP-dependent Lon protease
MTVSKDNNKKDGTKKGNKGKISNDPNTANPTTSSTLPNILSSIFSMNNNNNGFNISGDGSLNNPFVFSNIPSLNNNPLFTFGSLPNDDNIKTEIEIIGQIDGKDNFIIKSGDNHDLTSKLDYYSTIGNVEELEKVKLTEKIWTQKAMNNASINNHVSVLDWWLKSGLELKYTQDAIDKASENDHVSVLDWWLKSGLELKYTHDAIDDASECDRVSVLDWWLKSGLELKYTQNAIDKASESGNVSVLNWWLKSGLELKYTQNAINNASANNRVSILEWWLKSGLELKYTHDAIDKASENNNISVLDWWLSNYKSDKVEFKHTENSMNKIKLNEELLIKQLKWWYNKGITDNIKFKYGKKFIEYLNNWTFSMATQFLIKNKMITQEEVDKCADITKKVNSFNIFDIFSGASAKKSVTSKYDITTLPEDIQKHIKEKEEELSSSAMINGKAKEYIDNLVKIPFGKYREEKIFKFMKDFIDKINNDCKGSNDEQKDVSKNKKRKHDDVKHVIINNESDLIAFLNSRPRDKYTELYEQYCNYRKDYLNYIDDVLDSSVYGHKKTKKHIKCIIAQWLSGGCSGKGVILGIQGPPGVGKTTFIKTALSKCLVDFIDYDINKFTITPTSLSTTRPFCFISLGGSTNGSTLIGHNITYHGATSGDIVKCLKEAQCMNPIIYFDELDKISKTEHGNEIASVLTHITDPVQNEHFTDRYFSEVKIDLSKCIIVFSYNDSSKIDRILHDRIQEIKVNAIQLSEKIEICKRFIIPSILKDLGYNENDVVFSREDIEYIITEYTFEAGVRKIKEKIQEILRNHNLLRITAPSSTVLTTPLTPTAHIIGNEYIKDVLKEHPQMRLKKITTKPKVGCIHGMYATTSGVGDIMLIQIKKCYSKDVLSLQTTGSLEKVISESMEVAKTVAWSLLTELEQKEVITNFANTGLHIHCPDGSTTKDGPSAGTAITCAIYSLLLSKHIKNTVAITGEIDLDGNVTAIGGLDAKLTGAKRAGVKTVIVPYENKHDVDIVIEKIPDLFDKSFKVKFVKHVSEVLKLVLCDK